MPSDDRQVFEAVARAGREAARRIWSARDDRGRLDAASLRLLGILEQHPEFRPYWDGADPPDDENPFIHVMYHDLVEKQIETDDPPEARAALERLVAAGEDRHDALHAIVKLLVLEIFRMTQNRGVLDREGYRRALARLGAEVSDPAPRRTGPA